MFRTAGTMSGRARSEAKSNPEAFRDLISYDSKAGYPHGLMTRGQYTPPPDGMQNVAPSLGAEKTPFLVGPGGTR